jgi:hypothetical protein
MARNEGRKHGYLVECLVVLLNGLYSLVGNNDVEKQAHYSTIRHSLPVVYYQGAKTEVALTVFGDEKYPKSDRRVYLQKRGWLSGLIGFPERADAGMDVTPESEIKTPYSRTEKRLENFEKRMEEVGFKPIETMIVRIPTSSGDGYFRLRVVCKGRNIVNSRSFRIISAGLNSAVIRGASAYALPFEFLFMALQLTLVTAAYTVLFAAFPFLKLAQAFPGTWQKHAIDRMWGWAGGQQRSEEFMKKYDVKNKFKSIDTRLPWAAAGVRRDFDMENDSARGSFYRFK